MDNNYQVGDIFTDDAEYSARAKWCNDNRKMIVEIEKNANGERQFQIQEVPAPTEEEILSELRFRREQECFSIINRGVLWYNTLTTEQQQELNTWYQAWLDVPQVYQETKPTDIETIIPTKPNWLK